MSSAKHDWQTPEHILDAVRKVAPIGLDPCTTAENPTGAGCWFSPTIDGLTRRWAGHGLAFVNPPYGRVVGDWLAKCPEADSCIALPASRTDTRWFHAALASADVMRLLKGRLRFKGAPASAPFPSVVFGWSPISSEGVRWRNRFREAFDPLGRIIDL